MTKISESNAWEDRSIKNELDAGLAKHDFDTLAQMISYLSIYGSAKIFGEQKEIKVQMKTILSQKLYI